MVYVEEKCITFNVLIHSIKYIVVCVCNETMNLLFEKQALIGLLKVIGKQKLFVSVNFNKISSKK